MHVHLHLVEKGNFMTLYRLLINVLSSDFGGNSDKITQVRKDLVSLDPSNHEAIPLVNSLLMQGMKVT